MALLDLSYVTRSYIELIKRAFANSPVWTSPVPEILPVPAGSLSGEGVCFYLYHVLEKKEYSNFPVSGNDQPPVRFLPMAINLYYQLTANSILQDENGPYNEQLMMSIAMKALHDCPYMDDSTMINTAPHTPMPILPLELQGQENRFKVTQQPVPFNDAVHNWTAGQSPMKLSAYYEVSTVFLEPEETTSYTGRVLAYGNYIFTRGAPRITVSQNFIGYSLPGETLVRQIKIQPAQASPAKALPAPVLQESMVSFLGHGFDGENVQLRLLNSRWDESVIAGGNWDLAVSESDRLTVTIRETAILERNGMEVDILPGMYSAQVVIMRIMKLPNGQNREFKNSSNQFPFIISPRLDNISPVSGTIVTITGYIFQYFVSGTDILEDKIEIYLGESRLIKNTTALFNPGEFRVTNPNTLEINISGPLTSGQEIPLRILINGAESAPAWIII